MKSFVLVTALFVAAGCGASSPPPGAARPSPIPGEPAPSASPAPSPVAEAPPEPEAAPEPAAAPEPEAQPQPQPPPEPVAAEPPAEIEGTLVSRAGKRVVVRLSADHPPELDSQATLLRFFSGKSGDKTPLGALGGLFGGNVSIGGWLSIADVVVKKVDKDVVTLEISEERSKMVMNGKPVNHFSAGSRVRLSARKD